MKLRDAQDIIQQREQTSASWLSGLATGALGAAIVFATIVACLMLTGCSGARRGLVRIDGDRYVPASPHSVTLTGHIVATAHSVEVWNPDEAWWKWAWLDLQAVHGQPYHTQRWGTVTVRDGVAWVKGGS